jgi:hypothetical protein
VEPKTPRGKITVDPNQIGGRPGDGIREWADIGARKVFRECVWAMDIPHDKLQPVKEYYGEEMGGLLGDLDCIGL